MRHLCLALCVCAMGFAADEAKPADVKPYPLDRCLLMGDGVDKDSASFVHQGQEFRFCCKGCITKFKKDPDKYVKMLAAEVAKQPGKSGAPTVK